MLRLNPQHDLQNVAAAVCVPVQAANTRFALHRTAMLPEVNAYEQERRDRIARNQQVLQELGLLQHPISGAAQAQQRAADQRRAQAAKRQRKEERQEAGEAAPPEPERRSRRLQGGTVENAGMELGSRLEDRCAAQALGLQGRCGTSRHVPAPVRPCHQSHRAPACCRQHPRCSSSSSTARQPVQIDLEALESGDGDPSVDAHNVMRVRR